ncbi:hypothetical protein DL98DRAFT_572382 [Cadophora sp. DSE1049]|nr:hypothetical protein DL98DRAFT_572382 [Cadophora sp. DSE1049]
MVYQNHPDNDSNIDSLPLLDFPADISVNPEGPDPGPETRSRDSDPENRERLPQGNPEVSPHPDHIDDNTPDLNSTVKNPGTKQRVQKSSKRSKAFLITGCGRWLFSVLVIGCLYATVWSYKDKPISSTSKSHFDLIIIGLSIAYGLNIADGLKEIGIHQSWWLLSRRGRSELENNLIIDCDGLTKLILLTFKAPRARTLISSVFWISINLAPQIGISVLSLTWSGDPGPTDIITIPGLHNITVADLTNFTQTGRFSAEAQNNSADGMAHLISKFAIGTIAAAAQVNPPMTILGTQPQQGLRLVISSPVGFHLLLGLLLAGQLVLLVIAGVLGPAES